MAERQLPLKGATNFRDLGGYRTADGRATRWGMLFRSGSLAALTDDDLLYLQEIGLKLVCDFRTDDERARAPSRLPADDGLEVVNLSIGTGANGQATGAVALLMSPDASGEAALQAILASYGRIAIDNVDKYRQMFGRILEPGRLPAMVHCTAGKDRTGIGSALLLLALGVPRETVVQDYALNRTYLTQQWRDAILHHLVPDPSRINQAVAQVIFDANPAYLEAALTAIEQQYGSIAMFLRNGVGVSADEQACLQQLLLE